MKPKKPVAPPANAAKQMRDQFWTSDSTNLANAYKKQLSNIKKYSSFPSETAAHNFYKKMTPADREIMNKRYSSANDSISAIEARRAGDSTFTKTRDKIYKNYDKQYKKIR